MEELLKVTDLTVKFNDPNQILEAVKAVSFSAYKGEFLCVVGESGSGKSALCKSILHLLGPDGFMEAKSQILDGVDIKDFSEKQMGQIRGNVAAMVFQDAMSTLNPTMTIGDQIGEAIAIHEKGITKEQRENRIIDLLKLVGIHYPKEAMKQYPYQFSGGMRQRVVLAIAVATHPKLLIADEPTTALDVTIQAQILELLVQLKKQFGMTILFVTHDLGIVAQVADRVLVMKDGSVVEENSVQEIFSRPKHPYTKHLLQVHPYHAARRETIESEGTKGMVMGMSHVSFSYPLSRRKKLQVLRDVSFDVREGEIYGLVGESGCGKSTIAKLLMGFLQTRDGEIYYQDKNLSDSDKRLSRKEKKRLNLNKERQMIFQDSSSSLNPKMTVEEIVLEPLRISKINTKRVDLDSKKEAEFRLQQVGLSKSYLHRYPAQLSGGERQRVAIARALTMEPKLLIADEPVASLDVSTQAEIAELFKRLQKEQGFSVLFITHDLSLVRTLCNRVAVMQDGRIVEIGTTKQIFEECKHPYTRRLLGAVPVPNPKKRV